MATDTNDEVTEAEPRPTETNAEGAETETRPDLTWDKEAPGLCVRVFGNGSKSFIFCYRVGDRQRFLRIGKTPIWSLEAARNWAKELRNVIDQGGDAESYNRDRHKFGPVENVIQYIREELRRNP